MQFWQKFAAEYFRFIQFTVKLFVVFRLRMAGSAADVVKSTIPRACFQCLFQQCLALPMMVNIVCGSNFVLCYELSFPFLTENGLPHVLCLNVKCRFEQSQNHFERMSVLDVLRPLSLKMRCAMLLSCFRSFGADFG